MILLMSADPHQGEALGHMLEGRSGAIVTASRITQAANALRSRPPTLLLYDARVPFGISAAEAIELLATARGHPHLLILASADGLPEYLPLEQHAEVHVMMYPASEHILRAAIMEYLTT